MDNMAAKLVVLAIDQRRKLIVCIISGIIAAVLISFLIPPRYVAHVTILPRQSPSSVAWLQGIADFGLSGTDQAGSLEGLYGRIVESDRILDSLVATRWLKPGNADSIDLFKLLHVSQNGPSSSDAKAVFEIKKRLRTQVVAFDRDDKTGFMELKVTVPRHSWLAAAMADSIANQLNSFMQEFRAGKALEQATFISGRVRETETSLRAADEALARFVTMNRLYSQSVSLAQEHRRLSREVESLSVVWLELRRQLELARIESNDHKRSLDILDPARIPVVRAWPNHFLSAAAGLVLGLSLWVFWVLGILLKNSVRSTLSSLKQQ